MTQGTSESVAVTRARALAWDLQESIAKRQYDCECQVGGVDAMSVDTDWLREVVWRGLLELLSAHVRLAARVREREAAAWDRACSWLDDGNDPDLVNMRAANPYREGKTDG